MNPKDSPLQENVPERDTASAETTYAETTYADTTDKEARRTIVLYSSKYGAAKTYAEWIAASLDCRVCELSAFTKKELQDYDIILYGGGVQAGGIRGLEQFTKWIRSDLKLRQMARRGTISKEDAEGTGAFDKQYYIFAVGISLDTPENRLQLRDINFDKDWLRDLPCFFLPGAFDPAKLAGVDKAIIKVAAKMFQDKSQEQAASEDAKVLHYFENGCDLIDRTRIQPLLEAVRSGSVPEEFRDLREPEPKKSFWKR